MTLPIIFIIVVIILIVLYTHFFKSKETDWTCVNGVNVPLRRVKSGDVQCMSVDARNCLWQPDQAACNKLISNKPPVIEGLTCGEQYKAVWGDDGYGSPNQWCSVGKTYFNTHQ